MRSAWIAGLVATAVLATSGVALAHDGHAPHGLALGHRGDAAVEASAAASGGQNGDESDKQDVTVLHGTITAVGSGNFSLQSGSQTVVVAYGSDAHLIQGGAAPAVGEQVVVRGTMSGGELHAATVAVLRQRPVHGTLSSAVTLVVDTGTGQQTVTLPAGTVVSVTPSGLHVDGTAKTQEQADAQKDETGPKKDD